RGANARPHTHDGTLDLQGRMALASVCVLLALRVMTGGSSQESGGGEFAAQLLALPLLAWAGWRLLRQRGTAIHGIWLALAVVLVAIPLLPSLLPGGMGAGTGRAALAGDLAQFGVDGPTRWSLAPAATRAAAFQLLPALAIFAMALSLPRAAHR